MANTPRNALVAGAVALSALVASGGILASGMGFKITYPLRSPASGVSKSGTNRLSLPYLRRSGLLTADDLQVHIEGHGGPFTKVITVSKFLEATDSLQTRTGYMGSPSANFSLLAGEGYSVQMRADVDYVIVGVHDPSVVVSLDAPGPGSKSGLNHFAPPYNATAATALDMIRDIEGGGPPFSKVRYIAKFLTVSDSLRAFTGRMGSPGANFPIVPGESYMIQMSVTVPYVASHY